MATVLQASDEPRSLDAFSRRLLVLVFSLTCVSLVVYLPEMLELFSEGPVIRTPHAGTYKYRLFRLPRELLALGIVFYLGYGLLLGTARRYLTLGVVRTLAVIALWSLACVSYAVIVKDLPLVVPLLGLRALQYTPLLLAGYVLAQKHSRALLLKFADLLRWYTAPIIGLGIGQTLFGHDDTTVFGTRSFGPFMNMNAFGSTLVLCALWFLLAGISHRKIHGTHRYGPWIGACAVAAFTTGSRTAMTLMVIVGGLAICYRLSRRVRLVGLVTLLLLLSGLFHLFTSSKLTGRVVSRSNSVRLAIVRQVVESFDTPADLLFGTGLGLYAKSVTVVFGQDSFPDQVGNPHSTYLDVAGSFGLSGLAALLLCLAFLVVRAPTPEGALFVLVVGLLALPMNLCGLYPVDALSLFLWGALLGIGRREAADLAPQARRLAEP